jgi:osmotically inducible protein OsmC
MALSKILGDAGHVPKKLATSAEVTLEQKDGGFSITAVKLTLEANIPGIDKKTFEELAGKAKAGCPVSKVLNADISLDAKLAGG